jgi:Zn-dependent protease/predicted transcriptional regulator
MEACQMKGSVVIGKVRGIEIEVNVSWLVVFGLVTYMLATNYFPQNYPDWNPALGWLLGGIIALMLFVSVLLHELSHSLVSMNFGIPVKKISLFIFGGIAQMEKEADEPGKELKIAVAGPAMSLLLFVLFTLFAAVAAVTGASEAILVLLTYVAQVNLVLAIFNMVPAFPMDGGRVLRALIWRFKGDFQNATRIAASMGGMFGYFLIFTGIFWVMTGNLINGIWFAFIGWFINQASQASYQQTVMSNIFDEIKISEFMTANVIAVDYHISVQELVDNYFYQYKFNSFPVKKFEEVIGVVNFDRAKNVPKEERDQTTVGRITTPLEENLVVSPDDTVSTAMTKIFGNSIGRVLVMEQAALIGIVSRTDILNYLRMHSQFNR